MQTAPKTEPGLQSRIEAFNAAGGDLGDGIEALARLAAELDAGVNAPALKARIEEKVTAFHKKQRPSRLLPPMLGAFIGTNTTLTLMSGGAFLIPALVLSAAALAGYVYYEGVHRRMGRKTDDEVIDLVLSLGLPNIKACEAALQAKVDSLQASPAAEGVDVQAAFNVARARLCDTAPVQIPVAAPVLGGRGG